MLMRFLTRALSPAGNRAKLSIFIFHRVLPKSDPHLPWEPDANQFDWILKSIGEHYRVLPLAEAVTRLESNSLPSAAAAITFDDGYADNLSVATPILKRHALSATFFVATSFLDGGRMWNDDVIEAFRWMPDGVSDLSDYGLGTHPITDTVSRVKAYGEVLKRLKYFAHGLRESIGQSLAEMTGIPAPVGLMLSSLQVQALRAQGMEVGAHTHTHPILELLPDVQAEREMADSRDRLEDLLGDRVVLFAYPNGEPGRDFSSRHALMARRLGFTAAVATTRGAAKVSSDRYQLPRFTPWDRTPLKFVLRSALNLTNS